MCLNLSIVNKSYQNKPKRDSSDYISLNKKDLSKVLTVECFAAWGWISLNVTSSLLDWHFIS